MFIKPYTSIRFTIMEIAGRRYTSKLMRPTSQKNTADCGSN